MFENVGVAVEIALPALSVQKLFLLPVQGPPFLNFGSWPPRNPRAMSGVPKEMICHAHCADTRYTSPE